MAALDLLLINTPIHDYRIYPEDSTSYSTPLGLLYLHSFVEQFGFECEVIDAEAARLSIEDIVSLIIERRPKYVGLNAFSVNFGYLRRIALAVEGAVGIIVGGPHVTLCSTEHLLQEFTFADYVVRGGGETALVKILSGCRDIALPNNVFFRTDGGRLYQGLVATTQQYTELSALVHPSRGVTPFEPYVSDGILWADIAISRGCKYRCAFCSGSSYSSGLAYSQRNIESTLEELLTLRANYNIGGIEIVDDLPFRNKDELLEFFDAISDSNLCFQWEMNLPIGLIRTLAAEQLQKLRERGLSRITFGVESGDEAIRYAMGKRVSNNEIVRICSSLSDAGISQKTYFIIGFPGESAGETLATIALAERIRTLSSYGAQISPRLFVYKPFPGSALWKDLVLRYSEDRLLNFIDFSLENSAYNKHAWMPQIQFCELPPSTLANMINDYYRGEDTVAI